MNSVKLRVTYPLRRYHHRLRLKRWYRNMCWWLSHRWCELTGKKIHGEHPCPWAMEKDYSCVGCSRLCCYCFGSDDEYPDLCDDCTVNALRATET